MPQASPDDLGAPRPGLSGSYSDSHYSSGVMAPKSPSKSPRIDALDFDANRTVRSHAPNHRSLLDDDVSLMSEIAEGILERDRQSMRREVIRVGSFACAILSW